jgi:putative ABC transport system substrate-binding protein
MTRRTIGLLVTLIFAILMAPLAAEVPPAGKVYRIGYLATTPPPVHLWEALLDGLRERGYREGQNLVFERRFSEGHAERFPAFAAEMVRLRVDLVIAITTPAALAVKHATQTLPVVMTTAIDPVGAELVASLARPGGNVTGTAILYPELSTKRLELLKDVVPGLACVAVLWNPANPEHRPALDAIEQVGRAVGVPLQRLELHNHREGAAVLAALSPRDASGLLVLTDPAFSMARIPLLAIHHRLPTIYLRKEFAVAGGLMSYGPSLAETYRRAAFYVGRILKGAKPADLPVEQPTRFELVVNLATATAIGLTVPSSLLFQADEVIR